MRLNLSRAKPSLLGHPETEPNQDGVEGGNTNEANWQRINRDKGVAPAPEWTHMSHPETIPNRLWLSERREKKL